MKNELDVLKSKNKHLSTEKDKLSKLVNLTNPKTIELIKQNTVYQDKVANLKKENHSNK